MGYLRNMDARMAVMQGLAKEGVAGAEEALEFMRKIKADYEGASSKLKAALDGAESIAQQMVDGVSPIVEDISDVTNLASLACQMIIRVTGALRPTKQQAERVRVAWRTWRKYTQPANRALIEDLETEFDVTILRWIETLDDEGDQTG